MFHSDDDISLFVQFFYIPMCLGNLFQGILSIDYRIESPRLNLLGKKGQILSPVFSIHFHTQINPILRKCFLSF